MKVEALSVLIIGLGDIAMGYDLGRDDVTWTHVAAILNHDHFNILAGVDPNTRRCDEFQRLTSAPAYGDVDEFLQVNRQPVDLVVIASPTQFHVSHYQKIKPLRPKLVLMEKPLVARHDTLAPLMAEIKSGPRVMVNLFRLYQRQINSVLHKVANSGRCRITIHYSKAIEHNAIHFMTLLLRHFGPCLKQGLMSLHHEPAHTFTFSQADVLMVPAIKNVDDNSMQVQSSMGTTYYLNGGRIFFQVDEHHHRQDFSEHEFHHHMAGVYEQCLAVIQGKDDDSLMLAHAGHELLMQGALQHARLHTV